jgi:formamidopyrimidine-DNA glycosylase
MPELPEVETIKNEIAPHLIGRHIKAVTVLWDKTVKEPPVAEFRARLAGRKIRDLNRRGKYLLIGLDHADTLIVHLKMTGSLLLQNSRAEPPLYTRAVLHLDDGNNVYFRDPRKFGRLWLVEDIESVVGNLGPEALGKELSPQKFTEIITRRKAPIKALLCDQTVLAGVGNLYADEADFLAGIHPERPGASLTAAECRRLYKAIREVLLAGIKNKGASIVNYYRPDGSKGTAHSEFRVARRRGLPCFVCGTPIKRIVVRGRGTYFCPKCQNYNSKIKSQKSKT